MTEDRRRIAVRPTGLIDTVEYSARLRAAMVDPMSRSIQLTSFATSDQAADLSEAPNCGGFGRIHHFDRDEGPDWPANPLPIDPVAARLGLQPIDRLRSQVFQSAGCNWRCWYCYVPFADLTARGGSMISVSEMVDGYLSLDDRPPLIDLTGGQPDLTPEWPVWFIEELTRRGEPDCFVWTDDNLSTDYLWRYLTPEQIGLLGEWPRYGRACCLKGYDEESFVFNTKARPEDFGNQFALLDRLRRETTIDFYVYVTFTAAEIGGLDRAMRQFVDRLERAGEALPLRTVPLRVLEWGPVSGRLDDQRRNALANQHEVLAAWQEQLERRYTVAERDLAIHEVPR